MQEIHGEVIKIYFLQPDTSYIYNLHAFDTSKNVKISDSNDHHVKTLNTFIENVSFISEAGLTVSPRLCQHFDAERFS